MSTPNPAAWDALAGHLAFRYPDDWRARLASYRNGTNPDLLAWREIGGEDYRPSPHKRRVGPGVNAARDTRIREAFLSGVPTELLTDRFGLTRTRIDQIIQEGRKPKGAFHDQSA